MTVELDSTYVQANNLPFFRVVQVISNFLKVQPFLKEFNESIYTYRREDIPNISLPAICVYPSYITSKSAGFRVSSLIRIEIIRNTGTNNRGATYPFIQNITERLIHSLCYNNEFYVRNLNREAPYIVLFGEKYATQYEEDTGTSILDIVCDVWIPRYLKFLEGVDFNPSGDESRVTVSPSIDNFNTRTNAGNYIDDIYKGLKP